MGNKKWEIHGRNFPMGKIWERGWRKAENIHKYFPLFPIPPPYFCHWEDFPHEFPISCFPSGNIQALKNIMDTIFFLMKTLVEAAAHAQGWMSENLI